MIKASKRNLLLTFASALSVIGVALLLQVPASALSGSEFNADRIIDDSVFYNGNSMTASEAQLFLNSKVPVCDTNGEKMYNSTQTRAQWAQANGKPLPPYVCLKDFKQDHGAMSDSGICSPVSAQTNRTAAQIIDDVARACNISQKALIVTLQKEQSLITDDWPWPVQYQKAMGYYCPDDPNNPGWCHPDYAGFFNQVYNAAKQFNRYKLFPGNFNHAVGRTSFVAYQANNTSCGGTNLTMQTAATAGLYNYTPYQPNAAALNNLYGTGNSCSAYGNRNFWRMFNDWFGPTIGSLVKTPYDNTVYLLSGDQAHPIYSVNILNDYSALGPVRTTSANEINKYHLGPVLGNMVGDPSGTLYLVNSNIKLPFTSCDSVADYGYSCGQVTSLSASLLSRLHTGPAVTPLLMPVSGGTVYYVTGGSKRAILSWHELLSFRISILNVLTDEFVGQIPTNSIPAHGPGTLVKTANSPTVYIVKDIHTLIPTSNFIYPQELGLGLGVRTTASSYTVSGLMENKIKCSGANYIATNGNKLLASDSILAQYNFDPASFIDGGLLCQNVKTSQQPLDRYIRVSNGSIYYVSSGQKQPFAGYDGYIAHGGNTNNTANVSDFFASTLPTGATLY